jgi:hypothetical protein
VLYAVCVGCCDSWLVYTMSLVLHFFWSAHAFLQLQLSASLLCGRFFLIVRALCRVMMDIVHANIADLNCVSVQNFVKFVVEMKPIFKMNYFVDHHFNLIESIKFLNARNELNFRNLWQMI